MRVLWLSNVPFASGDVAGSGSWLAALARGLVSTGAVELHNVAPGDGRSSYRRSEGRVREDVVPALQVRRDGALSRAAVSGVTALVRESAPDVVHVWGTEQSWGLLTARRLIQTPAMLEMQGLKEPCERVFAGGLSACEQARCVRPRELVEGRSTLTVRRDFAQWSGVEREIVAGHEHITTQSPWVEAWVRAHNATARLYHTELALRPPFYEAAPWRPGDDPVVFCSTAYALPFKGLHDALRAFALLVRRYPHARLRIAGGIARGAEVRRDGYVSWLHALASRLGVSGRIDWLGSLTAQGIVAELQRCSLFLMPSHCESYGMALAEAMYLGVPAVCAHTGGTDWLGRDEESALFFPAGDHVMCAYQMQRAVADVTLARRLSGAARATAVKRHDLERIVAGQLQRYRDVAG